MAPPSSVLRAFGATGEPERLTGGSGLAWKVGDRILKPDNVDPVELDWQNSVLPTIPPNEFRLALPIRAAAGSMLVHGWAAWPLLRGHHEHGRWIDIIEVGRRFHAAIAHLDRPGFIAERSHPWAIADRVAWDEESDVPYRQIPYVAELRDRLRPVRAVSQLIHGDLTGNVLFDDEEAPAIIDLTLYWRPPGFATAIVVADGLVWEGATRELFDHATRTEHEFAHLLARALIFRLVAAALGASEDSAGMFDRYGLAVGLAITNGRHRIDTAGF